MLLAAMAAGFGLGQAGAVRVELPAGPGPAEETFADSAPRSRTDRATHVLPTGFDARDAMDPRVSRWRSDLLRVPVRLLDAYLSKPDPWRDELVPILAAHRVPPEFVYLALLESDMDPDAESPAQAVGLWQFTAPTARDYGLTVGEEVDQRRDWRLSTSAAARYLRDLHDLFGTWPLAAAAYNAGPGRVSRALAETGADSYWELVEAGRLPAETRSYVPKFLAILQLAAEREARRGSGAAGIGLAPASGPRDADD